MGIKLETGYTGDCEIVFPASLADLTVLTLQNMCFHKGQAKALHPEEKKIELYAGKQISGIRNYDAALEERITSVRDKLIGKFDDRKWRIDGIKMEEGITNVFLAPTHYQEILHNDIAAYNNPEWYDQLMQQGLKDYDDPWAYFAKPISLSTALESYDGHIIIMQRGEKQKLFPGFWHNYAGFFDCDFAEFDVLNKPQANSLLYDALVKGMLKELYEEGGIGRRDIAEMKITGIVRNVLTYEFTFSTRTTLPTEEVYNRREQAKDKEESKLLKNFNIGGLIDFVNKHHKQFVAPGLSGLVIHLAHKDPEAISHLTFLK